MHFGPEQRLQGKDLPFKMDAAIAQMVAFTDTTPDRAQQYLQVTDGDVEQAVSLFFESGGGDLGGTTTTSAAAPAVASGSGAAEDPISIDEDEMADVRQPRSTGGAEDDEAMARRLQEEMYGATGQEEDIRAPIARQTETLVGSGSEYYGGSSLDEAVQERLQAFSSRRGEWLAQSCVSSSC